MASGLDPLSPLLLNGDAPDGWCRRRLGEIADISGGTTPSRAEERYWGGSTQWATPTDLTVRPGGVLEIATTAEALTREAIEETSVRVLPVNSVLMSSRATIGEVAINTVPMATNQGFCNFVPKKGTDSIFLAQWLAGNRKRLERLAGGSTFLELAKRDAREVQIHLPPLPEQRKIAAILSAVDHAIAATRKVFEQTKRVKQGLLQSLMTRGIGHTRSKETEIGEIPEAWEVASLGDLAQFQNGKAIKPGQWQDEGLPIIRIPQLTAQQDIEHWIDPEQVESRYLVEAGDLLFSWSGSLTIARWAGQKAALNQHVFNVRARSNVDDGFLEFLLKYNVQALEARTHGTTMRHITKATLLNFGTVRPPIEEQQEIARRLAAVQATERCHATAKQFLKALKRGLMQDLLTGRVRVNAD